MSKKLVLIILLVFPIAACTSTPPEDVIQTAIAETAAALARGG